MDTDRENNADRPDRDDAHQYIDRSKIDFDPDDGLYTGTAVDGTSDIPGPHEQDDGEPGESPERRKPGQQAETPQ